MVYFWNPAECVSQTAKTTNIVFRTVFCILTTSSGIHICTLKQYSMSTCMQNKYTQLHLVEAENAISIYNNSNIDGRIAWINNDVVCMSITIMITRQFVNRAWCMCWKRHNVLPCNTCLPSHTTKWYGNDIGNQVVWQC